VPTYCSPAHRQAAYRERLAENRELVPGRPSLREEFEALRTALERVSHAKSWAEARRLLGEGVGIDGRSAT